VESTQIGPPKLSFRRAFAFFQLKIQLLRSCEFELVREEKLGILGKFGLFWREPFWSAFRAQGTEQADLLES
jgi:hypothetical protein